ncbi:deoxyribodipyrimidine photo-lyase [Candidatus Solincola tengchongensis]|uniref:deoxyribodipyrimidine photo-lyase n=1 Tax=Candidatus Solincola tengchongensis TaxID=2900693 RepID=UPI00257E9A9F|nr:deoxyribodipyrimidine photo-lyase [Candidatus Solincola tengchongensis]
MIQSERVKVLRGGTPAAGRYVLYWMQASQRTVYNHALEFAVERANELGLPLVVFFGITARYPGANRRHYLFMLEGLREVGEALSERGAQFVVRKVSPEKGALQLAGEASLVVVDRGYLCGQREWREWLVRRSPCPVFQVESDVVVPVETASRKEEYSAATLRPRIKRLLPAFLVPLSERRLKRRNPQFELEGVDLSDPASLAEEVRATPAPEPVLIPPGGTSEARARLRSFIREKLDLYHLLSNHPELDYTSGLSPYLHFGQISPLEVALEVGKVKGPGAAAFLEQLIVRRELSVNFVFYNPTYDSLSALPAWARQTMEEHARDRREYLYEFEELERARTHDPFWNAAQREMLATGRMHNYMRMYWGKKILEWTPTPQEALRVMIRLNDKYELDGRDPNGYAGILWCLGKHDRPFAEREVTGKVRWMSQRGLLRKFDMESYLKRVDSYFGEKTPSRGASPSANP